MSVKWHINMLIFIINKTVLTHLTCFLGLVIDKVPFETFFSVNPTGLYGPAGIIWVSDPWGWGVMAQVLSAASAQAVNQENIVKWLESYKQLLINCNIMDLPSHIWNADECGVQDVFVSTRAVGETGQDLYQTQVTSGEEG